MSINRSQYHSKSVFITGGASGIGLYIAKVMLKAGANLAIFDIYISDAVKEELAQVKNNEQQKIVFNIVDVRDFDAVNIAVIESTKNLGKPDLALNAAGVMIAKTFEELSAQEFERVVAINLFGSRNFAAAVLPLMSRGGQLVFVASLAGLVTNYTYAAYCASKYAVVALAGVLRQEYLIKGIAISVICPPEVDTPMVLEEIKTMHPVTKKLKALAGSIKLEQACGEMLSGVNHRKFLIIPSFRARLTYWLERYIPRGIFNLVIDGIIRKTLAKHTEK